MKYLAIVLGVMLLSSCANMGMSGGDGSRMSNLERNMCEYQHGFEPYDPNACR
jgi:hypothetical protein